MNAVHQRLIDDHNELLKKSDSLVKGNEQSINLSQIDDDNESVIANSETTLANLNVKLTNKRALLVDGSEQELEKKLKTQQEIGANVDQSSEEHKQIEDHQAEQEVIEEKKDSFLGMLKKKLW